MNLLFNYVVALTNINGVITKEKVTEIYNMQNKTSISVSDVESLMTHYEKELRNHSVEVKDPYFSHDVIFTFDELKELLLRKENKPYYIPDKKTLLKYTDDEFYEETKQTKKLYRFLEKYVQPDNVNSVEDVFFDILTNCQMEEEPLNIISYLDQIDVTFPTKNELKEALDLIIDMYNHTKLWSNNGFSPAEIFEKSEKPNLHPLNIKDGGTQQLNTEDTSSKKIGRNEPCPCGSGKKYKKCYLVKA